MSILFLAQSIWDRLPPPTTKKVPGNAAAPIPGELRVIAYNLKFSFVKCFQHFNYYNDIMRRVKPHDF